MRGTSRRTSAARLRTAAWEDRSARRSIGGAPVATFATRSSAALPRALSLHTLRRAWSFFTDETSPPSAAGQGCGNASTITARLESQAGETEGR